MTFEYEIVQVGSLPEDDLKTRLDDLGIQGYQLVLLVPSSTTNQSVLILMKETP